MADIVCPKCGKPNPAGSKTCRYCNSSLTAADNSSKIPIPPAGKADDTPDWLNSLRTDTSSLPAWNEHGADENPPSGNLAEGDVPDWLQRIRERNQETNDEATQPEHEDAAEQASSEKEQLPDWLNQPPTNVNSSSTTALEEWLKKLREEEPETEKKPATTSQPASKPAITQPKKSAVQPDDETSAWLQGLQTWKPRSSLFDANSSDDQTGQIHPETSTSNQKPSSEPSAKQENVEPTDLLSRVPAPPPISPDESTSTSGHTGVTDWLRHLPAQLKDKPASKTGSVHEAGTSDWLQDLRIQPDLDASTGEEPLQNVTPGQSDQEPEALPTEETPDWLKSFAPSPAEPAAPAQPLQQSPAAPSEEMPDWLKNFTPSPAEPTAPAQFVKQGPAAPSDETPDWLKPFAPGPAESAAPAQPVQQSPATPSDETPDWLKSFAAGPAENAAPSEEMPDWLKSFAPATAESAAPAQPAAPIQPVQQSPVAPSDETPDWLKPFAPGTAESAAPVQPIEQGQAAQAEETPDWMKSFASGPAEPAAPTQPVEQGQAAPAEETPDWLKSFAAGPAEPTAPVQPVEQAQAAPAEETPDWLKSFAAEPAEPTATAQPVEQAPAAPAEETPDWLKSFAAGPAEPTAPVQPIEEAQAMPAEETPDWLKSFATGPVEPATPEQPVEQVPAAPAEETPDWLKSFAAGTKEAASFSDAQPAQANEVADQPQTVSAQPVFPAEAVVPSGPTPGISQPAEKAEPAQALPPLSGEVPDWLQNMAGRPAAAEASPDLASQQPAGENEPDWLQSFASAGATTPSASDSGSKTAQPSKELAVSENVPQAEPDWLNKITKVTPPVDQESSTPVTPAIETGGAVLGEIPDWLSNMKPQKIPTPEETGRPAFVLDSSSMDLSGSEELGKNPFAGEGVPDWLSQVPQGAEGQAAQAGQADDSGEHLEPAQLPGWLQAMRPLEAVAPAAVKIDDQRVEKSGPLAGIKGVLPVDDVVTQYRKPPSYSVKLKVSEKQRASANLLEQMLGQESSPQAIPQEHVRIPQRFVRLVIAILLIAVLLFPLLTRGANLVSPVLTPPADVAQFHTALDALPDGGHVLLAVDYDPGFAGEMHFAATGVLERLIEKNESLALISTVPAGPVMAQDLISQTLQNRPDLAAKYAISNSVVNLGYLPGGATSLQEFAVAPRQATFYGFAAGVDANSPWQQPTLQNIQDVSQFSMVLVLTDSLDSGRAWIEQVQPALKSTPLMMVVSAQTAPLIQPYVSSGQVKAMISGLAGGTAFQQYLNTPLNSLAVWNAYIYGLLVLVVFILLGIVIQIGNLLLSHRKSGG